MKKFLTEKSSRMNQIKGQEIANSLWALATLNYVPHGLLDVLEAYLVETFQKDFTVVKISKVFTRQELANVAFSLAVFGHYPRRLVELVYMGLLGIGDRCDPSYVQSCYKDGGIDQAQINSLTYLQTMLDLELGEEARQFALPDNFPEDWTNDYGFSGKMNRLSSSSSSLPTSEDASSLLTGFIEINTSNTQVAVSKAFDRIGFSHVDEHIHTMQDLVETYGIRMGSYPIEMLSMDIANVENRIGIELDGPGHFVSNIYSTSSDDDILSNVGYYRQNNKGTYEYVFKWNARDQQMNGSTALKMRMFQKLGWKIVNIPFWAWTDVKTNEKLEEEYCQKVLDNVL
jgi:hypothetical protein